MKFKYCTILLGVLFMSSCKENLEIGVPTFDVKTAKTSYKAGENVDFDITGGETHMISFYSGEVLKEYASREGRVIDVSKSGITGSFTSSVQLGAQTNQLAILASTNFNGDYSSVAKVKAATWTDITSRFALGTGTALLASGNKDLSDLVVAGKPLYIAFRFLTKPQAINGLTRQWFIQSFSINSNLKLDNSITLPIVDQASAGFRIIDDNANNAAKALSSVSATRVTLQGNTYLHPGLPQFNQNDPIFDPKNPIYDPNSPLFSATAKYVPFVPFDPNSPYNDPATEHWAVSKGIMIDKVDLGPDRSTPLKGLPNPTISKHSYIYTKPGNYKAVFIAANNSIDGDKTVIKEINLTITP
ncbi:DUF5017 domain-containing protein [Daejeonella lutea]|uniref:DUF5017 domain-containing protein n=1 Tax=Daejeonella lutea TaxID=572036 RepID=A0A1T5A6Q0_9SPHI|nr:DUF5017 domain-containing protein [Daejeonella lutea]SKB30671.1 protein of unknown function [Daejeonella lutea]